MDILISVGYSYKYLLNLTFLLGVDTVGVVDGAVPLGDTDTGGSGSGQVSAGMKAHVSEALNRKIAGNQIHKTSFWVDFYNFIFFL